MPTTIKTITSAQGGVKNYLNAYSSSFSGWTNVSTGATGSTTTTSAELPEVTVGSALKVTNGGSGTGYVESPEFKIDTADLGKLLVLSYSFLTSTSVAYAAGDLQFQVWDSTTSGGTYAQNTTVSTGNVPAASTGSSFAPTFSQNNARPFTKIRIVRSAGASNSWASFSSITVSPGAQQQSYAGGPWETSTSWTIGTTGAAITPGAGATYYRRTYRDGEYAVIRWEYKQTGPGSSPSVSYKLPLPSGLNIDPAKIEVVSASGYSGVCGDGYWQNNSVTFFRMQPFYNPGTTDSVFCFLMNDTTSPSNIWSSTAGSFTGTGVTEFAVEARVPIAQWAGNGTVNLGPGAQVEYASNSSTSTTTSDTTSFAYGPQGSQIQNITAGLARRVRFQYPVQADDLIVFEVSTDRVQWYPLDNAITGSVGGLVPWQTQNGETYGAGRLFKVNSTDIDVAFGRYAYTTQTTFGGAGQAYSVDAGSYYWRVRKAKASSPVGFGLAGTDGSAGLYKAGQAPGISTTVSAFPSAGYIGETKYILRSSSAAMGTTSTWTDGSDGTNSSIVLTPGIWQITLSWYISPNGGTITQGNEMDVGWSTTPGNASTGQNNAYNSAQWIYQTATAGFSQYWSGFLPPVTVRCDGTNIYLPDGSSLSGTTVYWKLFHQTTGTVPNYRGHLRAVRIA